MRILLTVSLAAVCFAQNPAFFNERPVVNYDWEYMPNIVCNIVNAHYNGRPGLAFINGVPNIHASPLIKVNQDEANYNRRSSCTMPGGLSYCRTLVGGGSMGDRFVAKRPPTLQSHVIHGNPNARVPLREVFLNPNYPLPLFMSCDEYPFASTIQGGSDSRISCVPDIEQEFQKMLMYRFYRDNRLCDHNTFFVGVYNLPPELNPVCKDFCTNPTRNMYQRDIYGEYIPVITATQDNYVCFASMDVV